MTATNESESFFSLLWSRRWLLGCGLLVGAVLAGLLSYMLTPRYRAQVQFSIVTDDDQSSLSRLTRQIPIGALAGFLGNPRGRSREEAIAFLRSRRFGEQFVRDNNLVPSLFPKRWDPERNAWRRGEREPTMWEAYKSFDRKVRKITEDRVSGFVTISFEWRDPNVARTWANAFVKQADDSLRKVDADEAQRSLTYLKTELSKTTLVDVQQSLYRLMEEQHKRLMLASVRQNFVFKTLDPAVAPDRDDEIWPNRPAFAITGGLFGVLAVMCWVAIASRPTAKTP